MKGASDKDPLVLEGITRAEFECFLWVFYNPLARLSHFSSRYLTRPFRKYSLYDMNIEEWTSILKLAQQWNFTEVKALALRGLENIPIPDIQKIVLYQTYNVDRSRLQDAYTALTIRDEAITIDEGREVGLETALQIAQAREIVRASVFSGRQAGNPRSLANLAGLELQILINKVFRLSSPGVASGYTTQRPTSDGTSTNPRDTSQTQSTQTNSGYSASNPPQGRLIGASSVEHFPNRCCRNGEPCQWIRKRAHKQATKWSHKRHNQWWCHKGSSQWTNMSP